MVTRLLNSTPVRWAATIFVVLAGFLAALWRAYVNGAQQERGKQKEAAYDAERQRAGIEADIDRGPDPRDELRRDWMRNTKPD